MRREPVIWVVLSLLGLGAAAGWSREIPVYREYTRSIQFYDNQGMMLMGAAMGPDRLALQSLKNSKAQEPYLGKETVLDLGFESGDSVFSQEKGRSFLPAQGSGGGEKKRRRRNSSPAKNWLAQSLKLPSLGQATTNAAATAMSAGFSDSSWGWLAEEVTGQPEGEVPLPEEMLTEEDFNPALAQEAALTSIGRGESSMATADRDRSDAAASAGGFPETDLLGQKPSGQIAGREAATSRDWTGGDRTASSTMKDYSVPTAMSEMSQTRAMLSEWSMDSRPDFSAVASGGSRGSRTGPSPSSAGFLSSGPETGTSRGWGSASAFSSASSGGSSMTRAGSWKGGWSSQNAGPGLSSRFGTPSDPVVPAPLPSREPVQPKGSSGGYKPAWY